MIPEIWKIQTARPPGTDISVKNFNLRIFLGFGKPNFEPLEHSIMIPESRSIKTSRPQGTDTNVLMSKILIDGSGSQNQGKPKPWTFRAFDSNTRKSKHLGFKTSRHQQHYPEKVTNLDFWGFFGFLNPHWWPTNQKQGKPTLWASWTFHNDTRKSKHLGLKASRHRHHCPECQISLVLEIFWVLTGSER